MRRPMRPAIAVATLVLVLAACGSAGSSGPPTAPAASDVRDPGMSMGHGDDIGALGEPGDPSTADRTIRMTASDQLTFDPAAVEVRAGETVTFEIENIGATIHEFVLGSSEYQAQHEQEMSSGMDMHGEPNVVEIPAGSTATLTWTFTEEGTTRFACHEPGHFAGGMVGDITVTP